MSVNDGVFGILFLNRYLGAAFRRAKPTEESEAFAYGSFGKGGDNVSVDRFRRFLRFGLSFIVEVERYSCRLFPMRIQRSIFGIRTTCIRYDIPADRYRSTPLIENVAFTHGRFGKGAKLAPANRF